MVFLKTKLKTLNEPHTTTPKHNVRDYQYLWQETSSLQHLFLSCTLKLISSLAHWGRGVEKKNNTQTPLQTEYLISTTQMFLGTSCIRAECFSSFSWHPFPLKHPTAPHCTFTESLLPIQGTRSCWRYKYWNPGFAWPFFINILEILCFLCQSQEKLDRSFDSYYSRGHAYTCAYTRTWLLGCCQNWRDISVFPFFQSQRSSQAISRWRGECSSVRALGIWSKAIT